MPFVVVQSHILRAQAVVLLGALEKVWLNAPLTDVGLNGIKPKVSHLT